MATVPRLGLRLQILLALAGVIVVAYVPLFFAITQMTQATGLAYREESARSLGRAVAAHVSDVAGSEPSRLSAILGSHVGESGAFAIAVYDEQGRALATAGADDERPRPPRRPFGEALARTRRASGGRALDVTLPTLHGAVVVRVKTDDELARAGSVVRGIAFYMLTFALALLAFAYIAISWAIVRPIERLARAADRVASGSRSFTASPATARELEELRISVMAMATSLRSEEEKLRSKVEELTTTTRRLGETREQLAGSERLASVGRLAAGVAHEIGNPISAIMGMHDLLADGDASEDERGDFLRRMRKETERIHVVVRDLLDYARPEPDRGGPITANVHAVVLDTLALVKPQKEWRQVDASVDVPGDLEVALSPQRLTQVLLNIALNAGAALASKPEGSPRSVSIEARSVDDTVRLTVTDDGPGVDEAVADRIFDPFVTTKDVGAGTGLGLAVCRGIVESAGGRLELDRAHRGGARFVIALPRAPRANDPVP